MFDPVRKTKTDVKKIASFTHTSSRHDLITSSIVDGMERGDAFITIKVKLSADESIIEFNTPTAELNLQGLLKQISQITNCTIIELRSGYDEHGSSLRHDADLTLAVSSTNKLKLLAILDQKQGYLFQDTHDKAKGPDIPQRTTWEPKDCRRWRPRRGTTLWKGPGSTNELLRR